MLVVSVVGPDDRAAFARLERSLGGQLPAVLTRIVGVRLKTAPTPADIISAWASQVRALPIGAPFALLDPRGYAAGPLLPPWPEARPAPFTLAVPRDQPRTGHYRSSAVLGVGGPWTDAALLAWARTAAQLATRKDVPTLERTYGSLLAAALALTVARAEEDGSYLPIASLPAERWAREADWCELCGAPQWVLPDGEHACPGKDVVLFRLTKGGAA